MSYCEKKCKCERCKNISIFIPPKEFCIEFERWHFTIGRFDSFIPEIGSNDVEKIYLEWMFFHFAYYNA